MEKVSLTKLWKEKPKDRDWGLAICKRSNCKKEFTKRTGNHLYCCKPIKRKYNRSIIQESNKSKCLFCKSDGINYIIDGDNVTLCDKHKQ